MSQVNAFYVVPSNPLRWFPEHAAVAGLQPDVRMAVNPQPIGAVFANSRWGAHEIPGDPQGRWLMDVDHAEDVSELAIAALPGVLVLPHVYDPSPVGDAVAGVLGFAKVLPTDSMLQTLAKLRAYGIVGAKPEPR